MPEMAFYTILSLQLKVRLFYLFQQGSVVPGGTVVHGGNVGGGAHRFKFFVVLLLADVLRLVYFQQDVGSIAYHIGGFIGGLLFVPLVNKFKTAHETARAMDKLDLTKLEKLATNYKLKDMLERIRNEDEREIQQVWLEEFMKNVKCPECKKKLTVKPGKAKCKNCGFNKIF